MPEPLYLVGLGVKVAGTVPVLWLAHRLPALLLLASMHSLNYQRQVGDREADFYHFLRGLCVLGAALICTAIWWPW